MKKLYTLFYLCCILISFIACDREKVEYTEGGDPQMVDVRLKDLLNVQVTEAPTGRSVASTDEYIVSLYKQDNTLVESWTYKDMPDLISVLSGNYYIKAMSHQLKQVDTKAYFEGTSEVFSIKPSAITEVKPITCEMKSIKAVVTFDEPLKKFLGTDVTVTIVVGENSHTYSDIEDAINNPIYFAPAKGEITVVYVIFDGTVDTYKENFTKTYSATSGGAVSINFTLKNVSEDVIEDSGLVSLKMKVDVSVTIIDKNHNIIAGEETIPDDEEGEGEDKTKPTIVGRGFNIKEAQIVPSSGQLTCIVDITASNRLAHLYVTIDSEVLTEDELAGVGLKKNFDLAYPEELQEGLGSLGFPVADQVIGQKSLEFNITTFVPLLAGLGSGTHKFIIKAVDQSNVATEETLTLITGN